MSGKYLFDTNTVIALFARDAAVLDQLKDVEEVFIPSIVLGELYYGAHKSSRSADNIARIDDLAINNVILDCDIERHDGMGRSSTAFNKKADQFLKTMYGLLRWLHNMISH